MKKAVSFLLASSMLFAFSACNKDKESKGGDKDNEISISTYGIDDTDDGSIVYGFEDEPEDDDSEFTVDGEAEAIKIFSCSNKNIFGLEKVVILENSVVIVFNKDISDKAICFDNESVLENAAMCINTNNSSELDRPYSVEEKDGRYVLSADLEFTEDDLADPNREVRIVSLGFRSEDVYTFIDFYADDMELYFRAENRDVHKQYYSGSEAKWNDVEAIIYEPEPESEDDPFGYTECLDLEENIPGWGHDESPYSTEVDGVRYEITHYGGYYLTVYITNNSDETKTVGGPRYYQSVKDGVIIDLSMGMREATGMYGRMMDMVPVKIKDMTDYDPETAVDDPEMNMIELAEGETFEIAPGQVYKVDVLIEDFDILDAGEYLLTYGDAQISFRMHWEQVW